MKHISPQELEQQLKEGRALSIIDVREYEEVAHGKIPGARHIPLGQLLERMNEFDKMRSIFSFVAQEIEVVWLVSC